MSSQLVFDFQIDWTFNITEHKSWSVWMARDICYLQIRWCAHAECCFFENRLNLSKWLSSLFVCKLNASKWIIIITWFWTFRKADICDVYSIDLFKTPQRIKTVLSLNAVLRCTFTLVRLPCEFIKYLFGTVKLLWWFLMEALIYAHLHRPRVGRYRSLCSSSVCLIIHPKGPSVCSTYSTYSTLLLHGQLHYGIVVSTKRLFSFYWLRAANCILHCLPYSKQQAGELYRPSLLSKIYYIAYMNYIFIYIIIYTNYMGQGSGPYAHFSPFRF